MINNMASEDYESGFREFLESAIEEENKGRYRVAISNYYKALTELCSYLILSKLEKTPKSHNEIFLFLRASFPKIYGAVDNAFSIYKKTYTLPGDKESCEAIKHAIKQISETEEFSKGIKEDIGKI